VDEWKRKRLSSVGADFIVANYVAHDPLISAVFA
jgi:hypothetical protein